MNSPETISSNKTDRFLVHVQHSPERIRLALMRLDNRPVVYVVQTNYENSNYGYDIYIANEWHGYPSDEMYERCLKFANNLLANEEKSVQDTLPDLAIDSTESADPVIEINIESE